MENKSKAETFLGFAIRAGKYRVGMNAVKTLKRAEMMIVCRSASDNTKKDCEKQAKKFNCPLIMTTKKDLEEMTYKPNSKVMAITDKGLKKAIENNMEDNFIARILGDK